MIWVYAVCKRPGLPLPLPRVRGLAQAPLGMTADDPLVAVLSRHAQAPDEPALDALWAHERVVESLMAERAVLPMRFGTTLPSADDVRQVLAGRRDVLLEALDRVRGRVELALRAMQPAACAASAPPPAAASGSEYLRARLAGSRTLAALHEPLAALAVAARCRPGRAPGELLRTAYLVDEPAVAHFRSVVERLQREHPEAALLCTGPWPAYSFVEAVTG
ncbi:MAG: gas vesicle protein [Microbacteriaceae bacterium]|nr:gas vesicle protein [Microbacteriaceae bacterium]